METMTFGTIDFIENVLEDIEEENVAPETSKQNISGTTTDDSGLLLPDVNIII